MNGQIITADIVCFLFLSIILFAILQGNKKHRRQSTKTFIVLLIISLLSIVIDSSSYIMEEFQTSDLLLKFLDFFAFSCIVVMTDIFAVYMISVIKEKTAASYKILTPLFIISLINIIILIVGTVNSKLFVIVDHKYYAKEWDIIAYILNLFYMLCLFIILIRYKNELGRKSTLGLGSYLIFPAILSLGVIFFNIPEFSYTSASLSLFIIYITVQSRTISDALVREEILTEVSHKDTLTGLLNRRAYEEFLQSDDAKSIKAVAFFDLNSLKYTNDKFGHAAGDQLVIRFANLLTNFFTKETVFRISGDEFVIPLNSSTNEETERKINVFKESIKANDRIASMGYAYSENEPILKMISDAEKEMYKDKALYYKETGRDRRS